MEVRTVDYHTGGEPFRIVTGGVDPPAGATILDKRRDALGRLDDVRKLLVFEPRGHADMYGCFVVEPNDGDADLGVVFFHNAGYSTACGHGTIALVTWALDEGVVERREGENRVVVDVPSGRLETMAEVVDGRVRSVRFRNVPSFVWAEGLELGERSLDIAFGGAFYASLEEQVEPDELPRLIELGRRLKREIEEWQDVVHPAEPELRDIYGVIFWQEESGDPLTQRNVTVFADGEVDRSPCGSGTSARLALLDRSGRLPRGAELRHLSIVGSEFRARVVGDTEVAGLPAVITEVEGSAYRTGEHVFTLDPDDPLREGFLLSLALAEQPQDLPVLGEASARVLGEDEVTVREDVELALSARRRLRVGARLRGDLGRETRGPCVVAASGRAVEDLDRHEPNSNARLSPLQAELEEARACRPGSRSTARSRGIRATGRARAPGPSKEACRGACGGSRCFARLDDDRLARDGGRVRFRGTGRARTAASSRTCLPTAVAGLRTRLRGRRRMR